MLESYPAQRGHAASMEAEYPSFVDRAKFRHSIVIMVKYFLVEQAEPIGSARILLDK